MLCGLLSLPGTRGTSYVLCVSNWIRLLLQSPVNHCRGSHGRWRGLPRLKAPSQQAPPGLLAPRALLSRPPPVGEAWRRHWPEPGLCSPPPLLSRRRYYKETSGLKLDVGAYMKALEVPTRFCPEPSSGTSDVPQTFLEKRPGLML